MRSVIARPPVLWCARHLIWSGSNEAAWTGPLGTAAAGTSQFQAVTPTLVQPLATSVTQYPWPQGYFFEFTDDEAHTFTAALRAQAAWTPLGVVNTFGITLDIEACTA